MEIERTWLWGSGGLVVGLLLGMAIGGDGREQREADLKRQEDLSKSVAAVSAAVSKIDSELDAIGGTVTGLDSKVAQVAEGQTGTIETLAKRIDGMGTELSAAFSGLGQNVTATLSDRFDDVRAAVSEVTNHAKGELEHRRGMRPSGQAAAPTTLGPDGLAVEVGRIVVFGNGSARVFLSGVDQAGETARVAINGPDQTTMKLGVPARAGVCEITLTGFTDTGGATFSGDCGASSPAAAPEAATPKPAEAEAAKSEPEASDASQAEVVEGDVQGTPIAIGTSATLVEGKLRVFVSGIDSEAKTARVAVNGPTTSVLALGEETPFGDCKLTLTGVSGRDASFLGSC